MSDLTIAAVLEFYGADLTRVAATGWRSLKCPFHSDQHASARVNLELGAFKCHGCEAYGDAISLIEHTEGLDFRGACEWSENILGASHQGIHEPAKKRQARKRSVWRHTLFD